MAPSIEDSAANEELEKSYAISQTSKKSNGHARVDSNSDTFGVNPQNDGLEMNSQQYAVKDTTHLPSPLPTPSPRHSPTLKPVDVATEAQAPSHSRRPSTSNDTPINFSLPRIVDDSGVLASPSMPRALLLQELQAIPEEKVKPRRKSSVSRPNGDILKLSAAEVKDLISSPDSLPLTSPVKLAVSGQTSLAASPVIDHQSTISEALKPSSDEQKPDARSRNRSDTIRASDGKAVLDTPLSTLRERPKFSSRTSSSQTTLRTPSFVRSSQRQSSPRRKVIPTSGIEPLDIGQPANKDFASSKSPLPEHPPSPIPQSIPLPPTSIPTYLQLELSSSRPSPLYIYRSQASEKTYESSKIKFERLLNFLLLPLHLEQVLSFGTLACLDAWLYTFTILPLRFFKALAVLMRWWVLILIREIKFIAGFIYHGSGRMWHRSRGRGDSIDSASRSRSVSRVSRPALSTTNSYQISSRTPDVGNSNGIAEHFKVNSERKSRTGWGRRHRRSKSMPSSLSSYHKADILQGAVIIGSCIILLKLDASRMYHGIRGQSGIKLYVIYNLLEAALGQDIFECLFSDEILERDAYGRSKILRPLGMFVLALIYNVVHATALFYQVIALNVAVNSYSNALVTLLMSNQFVEIKSTVFKKFEKDNLFQLTCADVVERFQLWLMLIIIALRNIIEFGGPQAMNEAAEAARDNMSAGFDIFAIIPPWLGEVLTPFFLVLGSEMGIDWLKHAYISKFNGVKPAVYQRYLDVLAKDYYTNAFVNQNLIKRLGLPVIPLSCLFIRSSVQTYHMFLATKITPPLPSATTSLSDLSESASPATTAALEHFDNIIRRALGRSAFGIPDPTAHARWYLPSTDDFIATLTMLTFFLGAFFVLLALKLVLGMILLRFARNRYAEMKNREHVSYDTGGKRVGGWGMIEVDEDKRRWIYDDDVEGLRKLREKERAAKEKAEKAVAEGKASDFSRISRYEMSAKRIW